MCVCVQSLCACMCSGWSWPQWYGSGVYFILLAHSYAHGGVVQVCTHTQIHTHTHTHTHTHFRTHTLSLTHTYIYIHIHTHTESYTYGDVVQAKVVPRGEGEVPHDSCICMYMYMRACIHIRLWTCTYIHTQKHLDMCVEYI